MGKIHIISDNRFFLYGVISCAFTELGEFYTYSPNEIGSAFIPKSNDIVIINVSDVRERRRITSLSGLCNICCRVIICLNTYKAEKRRFARSYAGSFPWLIPLNIQVDDLRLCLIRAGRSPLLQKTFNRTELTIFHCLNKGLPLSQLATMRSIGLTEKYIYTLRRKIVREQELSGHSAITVMACRDIMSLSQIQE